MARKSLLRKTNALASNLAAIIFILTTFKQFIPTTIISYLTTIFNHVVAYFRNEVSITFYQYKTGNYIRSRAYTAVKSYLASISTATSSARCIKAETTSTRKKSIESLVFSVVGHEAISDVFDGVQFNWTTGTIAPNRRSDAENRYFQLSCNGKHRTLAMEKYLKHVVDAGEDIKNKKRTRMLYTNNPSTDWKDPKRGYWSKIVFDHPSNFDNLAMDASRKEEIMDDLIMFSKSRDYYNRIGKAWKRGYLLYGPPGTGKSTIIACMANLLCYDVYDIELTTINSNSELRTLLINTGEKAVIVIEDIDCSLPITGKRFKKEKLKNWDVLDSYSDSDSNSDLDIENVEKGVTTTKSTKDDSSGKSSRVTLSGLLNTIDGLWSPCVGERIIVFTTNHVEKLDPALIRTGRMDKHIELSYCTFEAFKVLAKNYLSIESHPLFERIEELLKEAKITPSDLAECLLPKTKDLGVEKRLAFVIRTIEKVKRRNNKQESKEMKLIN